MTKPRAALRRSVDDFVVDEIPAYAAQGEGEHLFVTIRKRGTTTLDALKRICAALAVDERGAGFAGMKDRHAVTTQTLSVPFPIGRGEGDALGLALDGIEVLAAKRHRNKLKPGHLVGNRFVVVLRELPPESLDEVSSVLVRAGELGVPNAFGPQRFGRDGDNPARALEWLSGRSRGPRDRREQRLLFSSLQAHLFNQVLDLRVSRGTWASPLLGDVVKKRDTGGMFECEDPVADGERAARGELSPTGPMFGMKMRWPTGEPGEMEREILVRNAGAADAFDRHRALGEGTRRSLRLPVDQMRVERLSDDPRGLRVHFVLPKGGYATTVLAQAALLDDTATIARGGSPDDDTKAGAADAELPTGE